MQRDEGKAYTRTLVYEVESIMAYWRSKKTAKMAGTEKVREKMA